MLLKVFEINVISMLIVSHIDWLAKILFVLV